MRRSPSDASSAGQNAGTASPSDKVTVARRGGRPSRIEAEQLRETILDAAAALFLSAGYGATTIEAVATQARVSKRTLYHRFDDKAALFGAVVHRVIERLHPPPDVPLIEGADVREILERLARLMVHGAVSAQAVALHRLVVAESGRFPKLAAVVGRQGATEEGVRLIAGVLDGEIRAGRLALDDPAFAAEEFLHMVISLPQRRALGLGAALSPADLDAWVRNVVNLFLNGCRGWAPKGEIG
jgi:TetR/AcrR family transcriptional regulator, mexJK operon transcriptional repressor